jgi:hypothetical protein
VLGTAAETQNSASKTTSEIDDENRIEKQFMSSQAFHRTPGRRIRETTAEERFESRNLELFNSVDQEHDRDEFLHQSTYPNTKKNQALSGDQKMKTQVDLAATAAAQVDLQQRPRHMDNASRMSLSTKNESQ